jgi:DNA-directed RNA polymerase specialized sigma24 family protein
MAANFEDAFAEVSGAELDRIAYSARPIHRAPTDRALDACFAGFDCERLKPGCRRLAWRRGCCVQDAEEAVDEELLALLEDRPEVFRWEPERWLGFLFRGAWFRLLGRRGGPRPASIEALEEFGDAPLSGAEPYASPTLRAEEDVSVETLPRPGERWTRRQAIGALQKFHHYHGRPPQARELKTQNRLPSYGIVRALFGGLGAALFAAGIQPAEQNRRRRAWTRLEAALACRAFYQRTGDWPNAGDAERNPGQLPGRATMLKFFGTTRGGAIRGTAEAIVAEAEA